MYFTVTRRARFRRNISSVLRGRCIITCVTQCRYFAQTDSYMCPLNTRATPISLLDTLLSSGLFNRRFLNTSGRCYCSGNSDAGDELDETTVSTSNNLTEDTVEQFCKSLENDKHGWWPLYVRGEVPHYPPRRDMFEYLTSQGVDVERMEAFEIEDFTRWLLMRKKYGPAYPRMPYDVTLEQKIEELKRRLPLK